MTMISVRKLDTAKLTAQAQHCVTVKDRAARRRKDMEALPPRVAASPSNFVELLYNDKTIKFQIGESYLSKRRDALRRKAEYRIENLLRMSDDMLQNLNATGIKNLRAASAQVSFSFAHARRSPVDFLTNYFGEAPMIQEINRRFFAARWTEQFEASDLHVAYLNAICVMEALAFWNSAPTPIPH